MDTLQKEVLVFTEHYLPASEVFVLEQARALPTYKARILATRRVLGPHTSPHTAETHILRDTTVGRISELLLKAARLPTPWLVQQARRSRLIHAHFGKNGYVLGPVAKASQRPLVTTFHGFDATYMGSPAAAGGVIQERFFRDGRAAMRYSNSWFIAVSDFIFERLISLGFPPERVYRHYIGIDTTIFKPSDIIRVPYRIVSVARFVDVKGHRFMIDAASDLWSSGLPVELVLVGAGPLRHEVESYAKGKLPSVTILSNLTQQEIRDLLASASLYLNCSVTLESGVAEALGLTILEAQGVGTPVVAFRSGGVPEAFADGSTGLAVPERDSKALASAAARLLTDRDMWDSFSRAAAERILAGFDLRRQSAYLEGIYDDISVKYNQRAGVT